MKTLYDIYEGIFDNDYEEKLGDRLIVNNLLSGSEQVREKAIQHLLDLLKYHNAKQHNTTAKMKNSDSYFVEFTHPLKVENGEATQILDSISYMQICKRVGSGYRVVSFNVSVHKFGNKISVHELSWRHTQPNFDPKSSNVELYEVPEDLNDMFRWIQTEAYNSKQK